MSHAQKSFHATRYSQNKVKEQTPPALLKLSDEFILEWLHLDGFARLERAALERDERFPVERRALGDIYR